MALKNSLRHMEALVDEVVHENRAQGVLRRALEAALAALMEAEVTEHAGAEYRSRDDGRQARRNGYRERRLDTGLGTLALRVPKLREGPSYMPSFLLAHQRSDKALLMAMVACYQQGVSTRKAEAVAHALGVESLSKSQVSAMAKALDPQVKAFRERKLPDCPYVFVDARYENVRHDHAVHKMAVLIAIGVRWDGGREVLGFGVYKVENEAWWSDFLEDLVARGLSDVRLVVSDAHQGLKRAIHSTLPSAKWQRCKVHFLRNLGSRIPKNRRAALLSLAKTIFEQPSQDEARQQRKQVAKVYRDAGQLDAADFLEEADEVLTHMEFPKEHWTKLHSTNMVERLNRELKRRTRVVSIFPNPDSLTRLAGALLLEEHEEWIVSRRYISERSMKRIKSITEQLEDLSPGSSQLLDQAAK